MCIYRNWVLFLFLETNSFSFVYKIIRAPLYGRPPRNKSLQIPVMAKSGIKTDYEIALCDQ